MNLKIRKATIKDIDEILKLFYETITNVCVADYNAEQIRVWASGSNKKERWEMRIDTQYFLVAEVNNKIVGFGSIEQGEYIDLLFVHKDYLKQGIANRILTELENDAEKYNKKQIYSNVSITAKAFFKKHGYKAIKEQKNLIVRVEIINFRMVKFL